MPGLLLCLRVSDRRWVDLTLVSLVTLLVSVGVGGCSRCGASNAPPACEDGQTREREPGCGSCTCHDGQWVCSTEACGAREGSAADLVSDPATDGTVAGCSVDPDCRVSGCSNEVCAAESVVTACLFDPTFACYREPLTRCGCFEGQCAWRPSPELDACLASGGEGAGRVDDQGPAGDGPPGPGGGVPRPPVDRMPPEGSETAVVP